MTKILSIIILICVLGGGIYFSKNYMKKGVSEGNPIGLTAESRTRQPLKITSPIDGLTVGAKYTMKWTGSTPKKVEKYHIYLTNASSSKNIFLGTVSPSEDGFKFTVSATTTMGIISGWKLSMYDDRVTKRASLLTDSPSFIIGTGRQNTTNFYGTINGPATVPISYIISISRDSVRPANPPKIKIACPTGVAALIPETSIWTGDQCGKELPTKMAPVEDNGFVYVYQLDLIFTNINTTSQTVSAQATIDGNVTTPNELSIPTTNSAPWIPKG